MDNITLIGMPGSGKSTLGRVLARELGYRFVDGDEIIVSSGRTLQEIIDEDGEEEFLGIEAAALTSLAGNGKVFAPGGSCVLSPAAMEHLRQLSVVIFLDVPLEILERRLAAAPMDTRGIVGLRRMSLAELFGARRPLYLHYAHLVVDLDDRPTGENLETLLRGIRQCGGPEP